MGCTTRCASLLAALAFGATALKQGALDPFTHAVPKRQKKDMDEVGAMDAPTPKPWRMEGVPDFENVPLFTIAETNDVININENAIGTKAKKCEEELEKDDRETRPMVEVMENHPDKNGYCLWGGASEHKSFWRPYAAGRPQGALSVCAVAKEKKDYLIAAVQFGAQEMYQSFAESPRRGYKAWDHKWHTDFNYLYMESAYCYYNGWLNKTKFPTEALYNATRLTELSQQECKIREGDFDIKDSEFFGKDTPTQEDVEGAREKSFSYYKRKTWQGPSSTNMRTHAQWKCMLGGLECDLANCMYNFCLFDNGFIGHAQQCNSDWFQKSDTDRYWAGAGRAHKAGEDKVSKMLADGT